LHSEPDRSRRQRTMSASAGAGDETSADGGRGTGGAGEVTLPRRGTRHRLTRAVERFPHFVAPVGATGTITEADEDYVCLRMDEHLPGAEEWDNEVVWSAEDDCDERGQPKASPSAAAAFRAGTEPLSG
jgi:hypothetical protein